MQDASEYVRMSGTRCQGHSSNHVTSKTFLKWRDLESFSQKTIFLTYDRVSEIFIV